MADAAARRLLVITYHYPPDGSVGGLRWAGYAKYLARLGWEVHVITAAEAATAVPGVHVHTCRRARTLNDTYNAVMRRIRSARPAAAAGSGAAAPATIPAPSLIRLIRAELAALLVIPDYARGWLLKSAWMARRLLRRMSFDAVVSSGPPHSAHVAGMLATLGMPGLHRVDMRDPWSDLIDKTWSSGTSSSRAGRWLTPRLERAVFRRAALVIANTAEFAEAARRKYPTLAVEWVPNGIDPEPLPARSADPGPGLSVAHVGTLYAGRDLGPVLAALGGFLAEHPEARAMTRLHLAGAVAGPHEARFREQVTAYALGDIVETHGVLPRDEALFLLCRSHLALVLAQDQEMQVPAKLYECVALGLPTLVIAEATSAAAREARRIGAIACEPTDIAGIVSVLRRLWLRTQPARIEPAAAIDYATLASDMDRVLRKDSASAGRRLS
ncbi:MAG TPA: glycosyltransferase [Longimicrobiales bacterium]